MVLKWNRKQMILGTGRLYEIKVDVRLSYMKWFHAKCKFHDYTKVKPWNGFGLKWSDCKTGLQNFFCYTKSKPQIVCNGWQKSEISGKLNKNITLNLLNPLKVKLWKLIIFRLKLFTSWFMLCKSKKSQNFEFLYFGTRNNGFRIFVFRYLK